MRIAEVMTRDVAVVSPRHSLREAARRMDELNVGALPVCDGERLVGIVIDRDITVRCTAIGASPVFTQVHEAMTDEVRYCFEDAPVEEAEEEMVRLQIRGLPVVDDRKRLVGMVSLGDLATDRALGQDLENVDSLMTVPSAQDARGPYESEKGQCPALH